MIDFKIGAFFRDLPKGELWKRIVFLLAIALSLSVSVVAFVHAVRWIDKPFPGFLINQRMVLGGVGQYHWTGTKAGLNYPDKVLAANGVPLKSPKDLEEVIKRMHVGEEVTYKVEQDGKVMEFAIPTMRFELEDFLVLYGIFFLAGIIYLLIISVVFLMKPESEVAWAFLWAFLPIGIYLFMAFDVIATHMGFIRVYMVLIWMIPASLFYLSLVFPEKRRIVEKYPALRQMIFIVPLVMMLPMELSYPGPLYVTLYGVTDFLILGAALSIVGSALYSYIKKTSVIARQRAKVILFGSALAFPIPAFLQLMVSLGETVGEYQILENLLVVPPQIIFPVAVAYAIAKHNLFDVDVFIKRTVGYTIMTVLVAAAYFAAQVVLKSYVLGPILGEGAKKIYPIIFALLIVFLFSPLNRLVQDAVDRMFYRKKFDYKETVLSISNALSSVLDEKEIVRRIVSTVRDAMFIDTSGLVVAGAQGEMLRGHFIVENGDEIGRSEEREVPLPPEDLLVALVFRERKMITKYDVAEDPRFARVRDTCGRRFEDLGASLAVPLIHKGEIKGILAVGHKKSGHFFTREDVDLLQTLAGHGAVAIENAQLAEQMKREEVVRTNLARYLSPQIVDQIVSQDVQVNLGGDRRVVTVLFSDIRDFTTITENRPPDQLVSILNEYFTEMAKIIFDNQGSLDKYIGDAIVAVFGSLIFVDNPTKNAVATAVGMMNRLPGMNREWETKYGFSMHIGIGVSTGEVFLGNVGSPERMEFTVIGDAVNVASRFSGLAQPGQILVTKRVVESLGAAFRVASLPPAEVKGKSGKIEVFEVLYPQPVS